jgi:hypothetical protein
MNAERNLITTLAGSGTMSQLISLPIFRRELAKFQRNKKARHRAGQYNLR